MKQTVEKLEGYTKVERLSVGTNVVAHRFTVDGKSVLVAWYEPGRLYFPGEAEPTTKAILPINSARVSITYTITQVGAATPRIETANATGGMVALTLSSTPIFVEPR